MKEEQIVSQDPRVMHGPFKNNPKIQKPNSFYQFIGDTYFAYGVIGVRRQIRDHSSSY